MKRHPHASASAPGAIAASGDIGSAWTTTIGMQVLGVSSVPLAVAAKDPAPVFTAVGLEQFTGRAWLAGEVDRFMASNRCGYVFITAEAGLGKTAFAAWLVKTRGWLSHFPRYGGRSTAAALQNLSAQLVRVFGLDDQAPGRMLPEWAQTPAGFESLLGMAAIRAREEGRRLVVVVDGLDEAESSEDGLSFGLPLLLPDGVYVVGTYRTGHAPRQPDTPVTTLRIARHDEQNRRDIREFLDVAAREGVLAARLAEASVDPGLFGAQLAERCDGVWVYLRYVLQELRIGLRRLDAIDDLPSGLRNYYADQIRRWQLNPAWEDVLLPLLATLGVAGEPLPAHTLARFAGSLDPVTVRRLCEFTFRPLLTITRTAASSTVLRYEIYHASFRDVLINRRDAQADRPDDELPYDLAVLGEDLAGATVLAHSRVADIYLSSFGGLDAALPVLAGNPAAAGIDDGYPLRHLARHLHHGERQEDLNRLLTTAYQARNGTIGNVWFAADDHAECLSSYLLDLARGRDASARSTDLSRAEGKAAPTLGAEIRYVLMGASVISRTTKISTKLLELLIRSGMWSPARAFDHVRRLADPADRVAALIAIHASQNAYPKSMIIAEALADTATIPGGDARAEALADLAPHLSADLFDQALAAATTIADDESRAEALTGLAPYLPDSQQSDALAQALTAAAAITHDYSRADVLASLVPNLSGSQQADAIAQALAAAASFGDYYHTEMLVKLAPHLPTDQLAQALAAIAAVTEDSYRPGLLADLAPHLPPGMLTQALTAAMAITSDFHRAKALARLAPHLPPDLLTQALATACSITDGDSRALAMAGLAPHLPASQQADALAQALAATASIGDYARAEVLAGRAPHLPASQQADALAQALAAAAHTYHDFHRRVLSSLAPRLPAELLARALATAATESDDVLRAQTLTILAPYLPAGLLAQALAVAAAITAG